MGSLIDDGGEKVNDNFLDFVMKKHKPDEESCPDDKTTPDIRWRVLSGKLTSSDDTKALLAKAVSILHVTPPSLTPSSHVSLPLVFFILKVFNSSLVTMVML